MTVPDDAPCVRTVLGDVAPDQLGHTQPHEHVLSDMSAIIQPWGLQTLSGEDDVSTGTGTMAVAQEFPASVQHAPALGGGRRRRAAALQGGGWRRAGRLLVGRHGPRPARPRACLPRDRGPHGDELERRGIVYAPDFIANAGGAIYDADQFRKGGFSPARVARNVDRIYDRTLDVFARADDAGIPFYAAARRLAEERLEDLAPVRRARG